MPLRELIRTLRAAPGPDRDLDVQIAIRMGYQRQEETPASGDGARQERRLWLIPTGESVSLVPFYTKKLDDAYALALSVVPKHAAAVAMVGGRGSAHIEDGDPETGANPPIALCIAVLKALLVGKDKNEQ